MNRWCSWHFLITKSFFPFRWETYIPNYMKSSTNAFTASLAMTSYLERIVENGDLASCTRHIAATQCRLLGWLCTNQRHNAPSPRELPYTICIRFPSPQRSSRPLQMGKKWSRRPKRKEIIQTGSINPGLYNSRKRWVLRVPSSWKVMQRVYNSFMYILTYFSLFNQVCCYSVQRLSSYFQGVGHKIILTAFFSGQLAQQMMNHAHELVQFIQCHILYITCMMVDHINVSPS